MSTVIKIVGQITLKALTDVKSTTYYYLLQSSMAAAPSKPITNPPTGGWSTTEPEFFIYMPTQDTTIISGKDYYTRSGEEGSYIYTKVLEPSIDDISNYYEKIYGDTRSLYVTVQTLYTDDTFDYSEPSLSSSYEAAKEAYNRAKTALDLAGDTNQYFWSLSSSYSTDVPAGVYVTHIPQSQFKSTPAQGNVLMQNTGLTIRNGAIALVSLTGNALNFYSPTTHNSAVQLSGQALNFYSPSDDRLALSLDSSGLNFYGSSTVNPDASLTLNGLMLKKGGIKAGTDRDNGFVYLSSEDYQLKDATHNGLTINGHTPTAAGTDGKTVNDPAWREIIGTKFGVDSEGNLYANNVDISGKIIATEGQIGGWNIGTDTNKSLFYGNQVPGAASNNLVISSNSAENTIPIAGSDINKHWFLSAGTKFGVDSDGNLYANNAHLSEAHVDGDIVAQSLTIGSGGGAYDGAAAINISGYDIVIYEDNTDESIVDHDNTTYLYPVMYHNGEIDETVDNTHYIWYVDDGNIGTIGDATKGGIIASYGHNYRVVYDFDDGAVGGGTEVQTRTVDPSKYITKIRDTGITIHPETVAANSNYIHIDGNSLMVKRQAGTTAAVSTDTVLANFGTTITIGDSSAKNIYIDSNGMQVRNGVNLLASFGTTAQIGQNDSSRFLINSDSLQAYDSSNTKYFKVSENELTWGSNNTAATTTQVSEAAQTATNFITKIGDTGIFVSPSGQSPTTEAPGNSTLINGQGMKVYKNGLQIASFGDLITLGLESGARAVYSQNGLQLYNSNNIETANFSSNKVSIGKDSLSNTINFCKDLIQFSTGTFTSWAPSSYGYSSNGLEAKLFTSQQGFTDYDALQLSNGASFSKNITLPNTPSSSDMSSNTSLECTAGSLYSGFLLRNSHLEHRTDNTGDVECINKISSNSTISGNSLILSTYKYIYSSSIGGEAKIELSTNGGVQNYVSGITMTGDSVQIITNREFSSNRSMTIVSDKRLKEHISNLQEDAYNFIHNLKPVRFIKDNEEHLGFYAQEVEEVNPWDTNLTPSIGEYKGLNYTELIAPLVTYCQYLETRISKLEGGSN